VDKLGVDIFVGCVDTDESDTGDTGLPKRPSIELPSVDERPYFSGMDLSDC
jgi:hypothetical protein